MGILLTWTAGLVLWIVLWAIGAKAFDAFMLTILMLVVAVSVHLITPHLPGNQVPEADDQ